MYITHFYDLKTGVFNGAQSWNPSPGALVHVPDGLGKYEATIEEVQGKRIEAGVLVDYAPPPIQPDSTEVLSARARALRDALLAECDWAAIRAAEIGEPMPEQWLAYRQELRDITKQPGFPTQIDWPERPKENQ